MLRVCITTIAIHSTRVLACFLPARELACLPTLSPNFDRPLKVVPEMKKLIADLRARGWRVVIVTASPTWIVEPGARRLGLGLEDVFGIEVSHHKWFWGAGRLVARCVGAGEGPHSSSAGKRNSVCDK